MKCIRFRRCLRWSAGLMILTSLSLYAEPLPPLFQTVVAYTNSASALGGLNNAGDLAIRLSFSGDLGGQQKLAPALVRDGVVTPLMAGEGMGITGVVVNGVTEPDQDGTVRVFGSVYQGDLQHAAIWPVEPDGEYALQILPNVVLPDGTSAPGEQRTGFALDMNAGGTVVGGGNSYLAGVAVVWNPPYDRAEQRLLSTRSEYRAVDDQGRMLANGVEFDHGGSNPHFGSALYPGPIEVPTLGGTAIEAMDLKGSLVVGQSTVPGDTAYRAFVWKIGEAASLELPDPDLDGIVRSEAQSVNASGDIVGGVTASGMGQVPVLWKNLGDHYAAYVIPTLVPDELEHPYSRLVWDLDGIAINDAGEIAVSYVQGSFNRENVVKLLRPIENGFVRPMSDSAYVLESDGVAKVELLLLRSGAAAEPVSVHFRSESGTAEAGADFEGMDGVVTWNAGESGSKFIEIPIIDDDMAEGDPDEMFNVVLDRPAGGELHHMNVIGVTIHDVPAALEFTGKSRWEDYNVLEGTSEVVVTVERKQSSDGELTANVTFEDGDAIAGEDYAPPRVGQLKWAAGEWGARTITIPLIAGSASAGTKRDFYIRLEGSVVGTDDDLQEAAGVNIVPESKVPAPELTPALSGPVKELLLNFFGVQGGTFVVESSTDMIQWTEIGIFDASNGRFEFSAPVALGERERYFRARLE